MSFLEPTALFFYDRTVLAYLKMFVFHYEIVKEQKVFGPERARTADLLLAKQALYQLSYRPLNAVATYKKWWAKEELHL